MISSRQIEHMKLWMFQNKKGRNHQCILLIKNDFRQKCNNDIHKCVWEFIYDNVSVRWVVCPAQICCPEFVISTLHCGWRLSGSDVHCNSILNSSLFNTNQITPRFYTPLSILDLYQTDRTRVQRTLVKSAWNIELSGTGRRLGLIGTSKSRNLLWLSSASTYNGTFDMEII